MNLSFSRWAVEALGDVRVKVNASRRFAEESLRWADEDEGEPKISMSFNSLDDGVRGMGGMVISSSSGRGQSTGGGGIEGCVLRVLM